MFMTEFMANANVLRHFLDADIDSSFLFWQTFFFHRPNDPVLIKSKTPKHNLQLLLKHLSIYCIAPNIGGVRFLRILKCFKLAGTYIGVNKPDSHNKTLDEKWRV
jgi:hypothetical protein